jgi:hypothetical protein
VSAVCASEFGFVAGVVSANMLHLFAFGMPEPGVLFVVCSRMGCVCVCVCFMRVAGESSVAPARVRSRERVCGVCL